MKNLNERRDELAMREAQTCKCAGPTCSGCEEITAALVKRGFDAAVAKLMPEIEKLVKALKFYAAGPHSFRDEMKDDCRYGGKRARQALTKFREFMGDGK